MCNNDSITNDYFKLKIIKLGKIKNNNELKVHTCISSFTSLNIKFIEFRIAIYISSSCNLCQCAI